ncbi:MAG: hypothetical protein V4850_10265 [Myxococcota bacterium]
MSMLLLLSIGCTNLAEREWVGGGSRYASGYANEEDTATDTGSTGSTEGTPDIVGGSCVYGEGEVAGQIYIVCGIAVDDSNADLPGGFVYFTLSGDGEVLLEDARGIVSEDANANTEALYANDNVTFTVGPVAEGVSHEIEVYVNDYTHNSSEETTVPVTGA